jgi:class 3 adenylate cyclase
LAIHSGRIKFCIETGKIVSDVINYAVHLEKSSTLPGTVSVSRAVYDALPLRISSIFRFGGIHEEIDFFRTVRRLDSLLCDEKPDSEERLA